MAIALLTLGVIMVLASYWYRRGMLRAVGRWMVLLGAMACWPAAMSEVCRYYNSVRLAGQVDAAAGELGNEPWYRLTRAAPERWELVRHRLWGTTGGTVLVTLGTVIHLGAGDRWRRRLYLPCLGLVVLGIGVLAWTWIAGQGVEATHGPGITVSRSHAMLAGLTVAVAMVALGVSVRRMHEPPPTGGMAGVGEESLLWIVAMVVAVATAAVGVWVAGRSWEQLTPVLGQPRDLAHMIVGGGIVGLILLLAVLVRRKVRRRCVIGVVGGLLVVLLGVEVWVGILMLYDGSDGGVSWYRFRDVVVQGR